MVLEVVSTGGTIASTGDSGSGVEPELSGDNLVADIPELEDIADVRTRDFSNIPSPHFSIDRMWELSQTVRKLDADPDVEGVIVTHGTDILEETAYFLDLTYGGETPVVFTGAMRNPSLQSPDGPVNLLTSARAAVDADARGRGVLVAFNERVHPARDVTKVHSTNVDTFRSPESGPLGVIDETRVTWLRRREESSPTLDPNAAQLTNAVHAVTVTADMNPAQIRAAGDAAALCFAATGAGHIPPSIVDPLFDLKDDDIPLIATTRCPEGRLARRTYGFRGSEATLKELDCYFSPLNLQKTRIAAVLGVGTDSLESLFEQP